MLRSVHTFYPTGHSLIQPSTMECLVYSNVEYSIGVFRVSFVSVIVSFSGIPCFGWWKASKCPICDRSSLLHSLSPHHTAGMIDLQSRILTGSPRVLCCQIRYFPFISELAMTLCMSLPPARLKYKCRVGTVENHGKKMVKKCARLL